MNWNAILGTRLFDRVGKRLILNDSGRGLLPMALAVLDGAKNIETALISGDHAAPVDLQLFASTTIGNYVLPRMLARFREEVPISRVQLRIGNTLDVVTRGARVRRGSRIHRGPVSRIRHDGSPLVGG